MLRPLIVGLLALGLSHAHITSFPELHDAYVLLQTSFAVRNDRTKVAGVKDAGSQVQRKPVWPMPDAPGTKITSADRAAVKALKFAVAAKSVPALTVAVKAPALLPVELNIEEGVYDLLFQVLHEYQDDGYQLLQQAAWTGLSHQSFTMRGSESIANFGGPNEGIQYMVEQMLAHPEPYYGYCPDHLTVQYEILACIFGLILLDNNNTRGPAAVEVGLVPAITHALRSEPDLIATQATACRVMSAVLLRNPDYADLFRDAGALPLLDEALERFKDGDSTRFHFGFTMGELYNISMCKYPKAVLEGDRVKAETLKREYLALAKDMKPWITIKA